MKVIRAWSPTGPNTVLRRKGTLSAIAIVLLSISVLIGCDNLFGSSSSSSSGQSRIGTVSQFWAMDLEKNSWYQLDAVLLAESEYSFVYVEQGYEEDVNGPAIAAEFDLNIYPMVTETFAPASDVDGTGKITILILDIRDGYTGSGGYVAGYYQPYQLFDLEYSNNRDMIYMDLDPLEPGSTDFFITIAHEFQHLVNFNKTFLLGNGQQQETWINEGLSTAAEYLYKGQHVSQRVLYHNADPSNNIASGYRFLVWENELANYSTVYLFFQWLRIHSSNGAGIYRDILSSTQMDYRSVEAAANTRLYNGSWSDYFGDWLAANFLNTPSGRYGYKGEVTLTPKYLFTDNENLKYPLLPGEAIYVKNDDVYTVPEEESPIRYGGLNTTGSIFSSGETISDPFVVVYSTDPDPRGPVHDSGPLPTVEASVVTQLSFSALQSAYLLPSSFPVDVVFDTRGNVYRETRSSELTARNRLSGITVGQ